MRLDVRCSSHLAFHEMYLNVPKVVCIIRLAVDELLSSISTQNARTFFLSSIKATPSFSHIFISFQNFL